VKPGVPQSWWWRRPHDLFTFDERKHVTRPKVGAECSPLHLQRVNGPFTFVLDRPSAGLWKEDVEGAAHAYELARRAERQLELPPFPDLSSLEQCLVENALKNEDGRHYLLFNQRRPGTSDLLSEQAVHVSAALLEELEPYRAKADDLVTTPAALDHAVGWLRKAGVDTNKPLHTLRKEFGSLIAEASDLFTASRQLRHSSLAVTASVYVENRKRVAPDIGAMLNPSGNKAMSK
jgi:hypothetical protein